MRWVSVVVAVVWIGCFEPSITARIDCSERGICPSGFACIEGVAGETPSAGGGGGGGGVGFVLFRGQLDASVGEVSPEPLALP